MKKLLIITSLLVSGATPVLASNADNFKAHDPIGWMMAVIAMGVVFSALVILFICFKYLYPFMVWAGLQLQKALHHEFQFKQRKDLKLSDLEKRDVKKSMLVKDANGNDINDQELAAAIGLALFLHEDGMHDQESGVLTLNSVQSPWTGAGQNQKKSPMRKF